MKRHAPAAARNREPILAVLREALPVQGTVLEVASGTGEHAVFFAENLPQLTWQPSDPDPDALISIEAWAADAGLPNLMEPVMLDAAAGTWPIESAEAVVCINMVHISPWTATEGLMRGAGRCSRPQRRWFSTGLTGAAAWRRRPATRRSTVRSGRAIRSGACAGSRTWRPRRSGTASRSNGRSKCRRTT